jgi:hypothetical protein
MYRFYLLSFKKKLEPYHASTIPRIFLKTPPPIEINLKLIYDVKEILNSKISHCEL